MLRILIFIRKAKLYGIFLFYLISPNLTTRANISKTFTDSLPFHASAGYVWSTWDFLTNPYLYYLQKDNAISAIINSPIDLTQGDYFLASRLSIVGFPIFVAFSINQPSTGQVTNENPIQVDRLDKTSEIRVRGLLGTNFGPALLNLGFGFFVYYANQSRELLDRTGENLTTESYITSGSIVPVSQRLPIRGGIELGQNLPGKTSPAWTLSVEYRMWPGSKRTQNLRDNKTEEFIDSPFLKFPDSDFVDNEAAREHEGKSRNEIAGNFLGWWPLPIGDSATIGLSGNFYYAFGSGRNSESLEDSRELPAIDATGERIQAGDFDYSRPEFGRYFPEIKLRGHNVTTTLFLDYDIHFLNESTLRFTPRISYTNIRESNTEQSPLEEAEEGAIPLDSFFVRQQKANFGITFKLVLNLTKSKNFAVYLGWIPDLTLYDQKVAQNSRISQNMTTDSSEETIIRTRTTDVPVFHANLSNFSLGFSYHFSKRLHLHFRASSNREEGKFDITSWDIGLDYIFTSEE